MPDDNRLDEPPLSDTPRHGYQGDRGATPQRPALPRGLTIAISREAGARGGTIGRRVARKLGWQVYDRELLEYMAQEGPTHQAMIDTLDPAVRVWVLERLVELRGAGRLQREADVMNLVQVILALGAEGGVVLIGRGAGFVLPRATTLRVRLVAPLPERVAYMGQWLRLTTDEAAERVRVRDSRRANFVESYLNCQASDPYAHDLIVNTSHLTEEQCAELILHAASIKAGQGFGEAPG